VTHRSTEHWSNLVPNELDVTLGQRGEEVLYYCLLYHVKLPVARAGAQQPPLHPGISSLRANSSEGADPGGTQAGGCV
jgi:hypothetical protein